MAGQYLEIGNADVNNYNVQAPQFVAGEEVELLVTDGLNNASGANSADFLIRYESATPDSVVNNQALTTQVKAVIEKEFLPGEWSVVAESQFATIEAEDARSLGVKFQIQSRNQADTGQRVAQDDGYLYEVNDNPGDKIRVRLCAVDNNPGAGSLTSLNVTIGVSLSDD